MSHERQEEQAEMEVFRTKMISDLTKVQEGNTAKEKRIRELSMQLEEKTKHLEKESIALVDTTDKYQQQLLKNQQQQGEMFSILIISI